MSPLGDLFPLEYRKRLALENLKQGAVIRIEVPDTVPPKVKRLIVVGIDSIKTNIATIFINSEVNPKIFPTPELQALHYKLEVSTCTFLDHDSFADCSRMRERNYIEILDLMTLEPGTHIGELSGDDWKAIRSLIQASRTNSIALKKKYGLIF